MLFLVGTHSFLPYGPRIAAGTSPWRMWGVTSHTTHRPLPARAHPHSVPTPGWWLGGVCSVAGAGVGVCMGTGRTAGPTPARRKGVRSPGQGAGGWAARQRRGTSWETPTGPLALPWAPAAGPPAAATPSPILPFVCMWLLCPLLPGLRQEHEVAPPSLSPAKDWSHTRSSPCRPRLWHPAWLLLYPWLCGLWHTGPPLLCPLLQAALLPARAPFP